MLTWSSMVVDAYLFVSLDSLRRLNPRLEPSSQLGNVHLTHAHWTSVANRVVESFESPCDFGFPQASQRACFDLNSSQGHATNTPRAAWRSVGVASMLTPAPASKIQQVQKIWPSAVQIGLHTPQMPSSWLQRVQTEQVQVATEVSTASISSTSITSLFRFFNWSIVQGGRGRHLPRAPSAPPLLTVSIYWRIGPRSPNAQRLPDLHLVASMICSSPGDKARSTSNRTSQPAVQKF